MKPSLDGSKQDFAFVALAHVEQDVFAVLQVGFDLLDCFALVAYLQFRHFLALYCFLQH